jgi:uracil-DNA glycosylase family 4
MRLADCFITAALRCAPPQNKPTPRELSNCFPYLVEEFVALDRTRVAIALGSIAFVALLALFRETGYALEPTRPKFGHGSEFTATKGDRRVHAIASYHPSRQNTNTGVLTVAMFEAIFERARELID